jgi:nitrite reductase (NADH) small subunit
MNKWIHVGQMSDVPKQGARRVCTAQGDIAIFRTADDKIYALEDRCPHKGGPLSQGIVHGSAVACPLHNWSISLVTGEAVGADKGCTPRIDLKCEGEDIYLLLETAVVMTVT